MAVLRSFLVLLLAQLAGEVLHRALHLPLPAPVLGMALLTLALLLRRREPEPALAALSDQLLRWMGLLFVPAGVGVFASAGLLRAAWRPVTVALVVSSLLTFAVTAWVMQTLGQRTKEQA